MAKLMLLQRVGGAVRNDLVTQLQPLLLVHEILRATLARPAPDLDAVREHSDRIRPAVQGAMEASAAATEWLLPPDGASTPSDELAAECVALLRPEFELGGLRLSLACEGAPLQIDRARGRTMICAVLAHAGDHAGTPGALPVRLAQRGGACELRLLAEPDRGASGADHLKPREAALSWDDLLALAELECAVLRREGDGTIVLELAAAAAA